MGSLNPRRERFAQEYIKDGNATQAAIRAGFSIGGAKQVASRLLTNVDIQARIADLRAPVVEAAQLTLANHLKALEELRDAAQAAKQFGPAVQAEASRGKASGLYTEKREVTFPGSAGVLMVPAPIAPADWAAQVAARQAALVAKPE